MTMDKDDHPTLMMGANLATGNELQGRGAAETEAEGFGQGTRTVSSAVSGSKKHNQKTLRLR